MRFHRDDTDKPWLLSDRLWESSPGVGYFLKCAAYMLGIVTVVDIVRWLIHAAYQSDPQPIAWASIPFVAGGFGLYFVAMKWMFRFYDIQERSITFEELLLQKLDRRDRDTGTGTAEIHDSDGWDNPRTVETPGTQVSTVAKRAKRAEPGDQEAGQRTEGPKAIGVRGRIPGARTGAAERNSRRAWVGGSSERYGVAG